MHSKCLSGNLKRIEETLRELKWLCELVASSFEHDDKYWGSIKEGSFSTDSAIVNFSRCWLMYLFLSNLKTWNV